MTTAAGAVLGADAFEALTARHRRELHVHCYRMLASVDEAEDAVQEVLLRAWRARDGLAPDPNLRAWLYRIATNVCLDAIRARRRRLTRLGSLAEVPWLQPYPDRLLDQVPAEGSAPDVLAVARETVDLAFIDAHERGDAQAAIPAAAPDIRVTMPPAPMVVDGIEALHPLLERAFGPDREGDWRLLPTAANRMPAAASYLRRPGDSEFRGFKLDVLRVEGDHIAEITTFGWSTFEGLGLPLIHRGG